MAGRKSDFTLTKLDDLFTTQAQRDEEQLSKIRDIPLELIDDFPDHPFKVRDDEDMMQLVESVKERGVITPATVRQKEDGRYELVSGHRRKRACELAGFETLRSIYLPLTRPPAFAMPPAEKRPFGRASHHAPYGVRPAHFCRAGGLGNPPTSGKGYSFPLLAKKVIDTPLSFNCPKIQYFRCIMKSSNTGEQTHTCATAFLLCYLTFGQ